MTAPAYSLKTILLAFILTISTVNSNFAQTEIRNDEDILIDSFFKNLYNFSFHEADSIVTVMSGTNMEAATISNIKANLAWWKLLSEDNIPENIKNCNFNIDESIRLNLTNDHRNLSTSLNIIYSYSLKARLENYRGNTFKSLISFYKSIAYIKKYIDKPISDEKLNLLFGLYFYFIDYIENKYYMMGTLLLSFPEGDKEKGLKYLEDCSASGNEMIRTEANYFLLKIYSTTEKDYLKAFNNALILTREYPKNLVYSLEQLKLLLILKKSEEAQIYMKRLIEEIQMAGNLNNLQKNHFISRIRQIKETGI